jgi:hypothetical protein
MAALTLNGTRQLLAYADDVNLLGDNIDTIKRTQKLTDASKHVLEVNVEKISCLMPSCDGSAGQNSDIEIDNRTFEM